jgi:hypothetical protein
MLTKARALCRWIVDAFDAIATAVCCLAFENLQKASEKGLSAQY